MRALLAGPRPYSSTATDARLAAALFAVFISDDEQCNSPLKGMPNQHRWGVETLPGFIEPLVRKGLRSVILFGVPEKKPKVRDCCGWGWKGRAQREAGLQQAACGADLRRGTTRRALLATVLRA